jgi:hypothetical protein
MYVQHSHNMLCQRDCVYRTDTEVKRIRHHNKLSRYKSVSVIQKYRLVCHNNGKN